MVLVWWQRTMNEFIEWNYLLNWIEINGAQFLNELVIHPLMLCYKYCEG